MIRIIDYFPISNLKLFIQVFFDKIKIAEISNKIPNYNLNVKDNGNKIFLLIIGESARPDNMSAYGYKRKTTPYLDAENKILLKNAYSPTSVTATSIPISLSKAKVKNHRIVDYSDNIINIANSIGFKTYWFSNQGKYGDHSNAITGIAMNCNEKEWISGFDENLLPLLDRALNVLDSRKKLIVLHLYGSHVPCKERYPDSSSFYKGKCEDDYYDNTIKYTDYIIFESLKKIKNKWFTYLFFRSWS
ncbi:phosphoethanolamine transferase [Providencia rettgeri]